jgi:hypothetical protein
MITILSALVSLLSFRVRRRASLEFELIALRHQVTVLRRQRPGRLRQDRDFVICLTTWSLPGDVTESPKEIDAAGIIPCSDLP